MDWKKTVQTNPIAKPNFHCYKILNTITTTQQKNDAYEKIKIPTPLVKVFINL